MSASDNSVTYVEVFGRLVMNPSLQLNDCFLQHSKAAQTGQRACAQRFLALFKSAVHNGIPKLLGDSAPQRAVGEFFENDFHEGIC